MTPTEAERAHAEAVAREQSQGRYPMPWLADLIQRERAAARDAAIDEVRIRVCPFEGEHPADYPESVSPCQCARIRALKAGAP